MSQLNRSAVHAIESDEIDTMLSREGVHPDEVLQTLLELIRAQDRLIAAQNATRGPQWWYMSVLILIMIVPVLAMAMALERYIRRGMLIGAVKG